MADGIHEISRVLGRLEESQEHMATQLSAHHEQIMKKMDDFATAAAAQDKRLTVVEAGNSDYIKTKKAGIRALLLAGGSGALAGAGTATGAEGLWHKLLTILVGGS